MDCNGSTIVERRKCEQKNDQKEENKNLTMFVRKKLDAQREKITRRNARQRKTRIWLALYIIFMAVTFLYCGHRFWAEMYFEQYGEWAPFYFKVFITFITMEALANWLGMQLHDTSHTINKDEQQEVSKKSLLEAEKGTDKSSEQKNTHLISNLTEEAREMLRKEIDNLSWRFCDICNQDKLPRQYSQLFSNYAHTPDILVHQFVHMEFSDDTLPILQNFGKNYFIAGECVGHYNQRYFVPLTFYTILMMVVMGPFTFCYLRDTFYDVSTVLDYLLPVTVYKWLTGCYDHQYIFCVIFLYSVWWILPMNAGQFVSQITFIYQGLTPHELDKNLSVQSTQTLSCRIRSVFGQFWFLNFFFSAVFLFRQEEDGKNWTYLRIVYKYKHGGKIPLRKNEE